jgi:hypothetical protein
LRDDTYHKGVVTIRWGGENFVRETESKVRRLFWLPQDLVVSRWMFESL